MNTRGSERTVRLGTSPFWHATRSFHSSIWNVCLLRYEVTNNQTNKPKLYHDQTRSGAHTASYPVVKQPEPEADHSHPSVAEVKNASSWQGA
jgi:hypothetical protein